MLRPLQQQKMGVTNKKTVDTANELFFAGKCNLATAASICGMTSREYKLVFTEYVKHNPPTYNIKENEQVKTR